LKGPVIFVWPYQYYVNVVGNVLGTTGQNTHYDGAYGSANATFYDDGIYALGWWGYDTANTRGQIPTPADPKVYNTIYRHGNYDVVNAVVLWDSGSATHVLSNSLVYAAKPAFFGTLAWPPYDPASPTAAAYTNIPAGYRFKFGEDPPAGLPTLNLSYRTFTAQ